MVTLRSCFPMLPHCLPAGNSGQQQLPDGSSPQRLCQQHLPDGSLPQCRHPLRHGTPGQQLRYGAPTSNKPHPAEKSTPVWLAIWHTWAGFANSQLRLATLRCIFIYMRPSPLLPPWSCCSDRRKSLGPSAPIAYATSVSPPDEAVAWPWAQVSRAGYGSRLA